MGCPWVTRGYSQTPDVKLGLVPALGQACRHVFFLLRSDGRVFGKNLDFRDCPRTFELLFHFNKLGGVGPSTWFFAIYASIPGRITVMCLYLCR